MFEIKSLLFFFVVMGLLVWRNQHLLVERVLPTIRRAHDIPPKSELNTTMLRSSPEISQSELTVVALPSNKTPANISHKTPANISPEVNEPSPEVPPEIPPKSTKESVAIIEHGECKKLAQFNLHGSHDCAIVGSSGILKGKNHGDEINKHDIIIRMNMGPVVGYEDDVGNRTDIRIINCPTWPAISKRTDAEKYAYLKKIDTYSNPRLISCAGPSSATRWTHAFRNKCLHERKIFSDKQMSKHKSERLKRYQPSFGFESVVRALHSCSRLHLYGMSNPGTHKNIDFHYYETTSEWGKEWKDRHHGKNWDFW
jgi:hypothetical protein